MSSSNKNKQRAPFGSSKNCQRFFSEPNLTIVSINIEGITNNKEDILSELCKTVNCDILCVQETHRGKMSPRPKINGMKLISELPHDRHGSAMFTKPDILVTSVGTTCSNGIEILTAEIGKYTVSSVYKPPSENFIFTPPINFHNQKLKFIIGDFNSHSISWGYNTTNTHGHQVEDWAEGNKLSLIHDAKLPYSFYSKIWKKGYNPDICFVSSILEDCSTKTVYKPLPKSQHRPIGINVYSALRAPKIPFRRRFNFKKANWLSFADDLDEAVLRIEAKPGNYETFINIVQSISRKHIPRGCRQQYFPGMNKTTKDLLTKYCALYNQDPFSVQTLECGSDLLQSMNLARQTKWIETLERMDMTHSSKMTWNLLKKLSGDPIAAKASCNISANKVAHQLLLNGKTKVRYKKPKPIQDTIQCCHYLKDPFTPTELNIGINMMKNGKAAGIDDLCTEQIKHFGPTTKKWLLSLLNYCRSTCKIPKSWRKSKVVAILKPGKDPELPTSYRPISLLCHLFKLYERLILHRIQHHVDHKLIPQQAGFRPGKSCTAQVLKLTEFIEEGFEKKLITGVALVDLTAAYDTVNHKILLSKIRNILKDPHLTKIIESLLQNRRFYVSLEGKKSRWRNQNNGLPQGSVLAPILFNLYTNDQPICENAQHFLYADDLAIATQARDFRGVETELTHALSVMSKYYKQNSLKPNPAKTQVSAFHLNNRGAKKKLEILWDGKLLEHVDQPTYLGVTLDRTLSYRFHCHKTKQKVSTRNNLLRKLAGNKWGAAPNLLRTTAQALCFSTGEYASPVWSRSSHAKKVDVALNETCRIVTGCLRATPIDSLYKAAGLEQPCNRRTAHEHLEKFKQLFDEHHVLYGAEFSESRLKSRKSFLRSVNIEPPNRYPIKQDPPPGLNLDWVTWKTLNRLRTGVAPVKANLVKWGFLPETDLYCDCGEVQDMTHLLLCQKCPTRCTRDDLWLGSNSAIDVAQYWAKKL